MFRFSLKRVALAALMIVAIGASASAQGRSQEHKKQTPVPPSRNDLAGPAAVTRSGGVTPFAWIDDATLLDPGAVSLAVSFFRWQHGDLSEVDAPVVDVAAGLADRAHFSASVPRVSGSTDPSGAAGGLGTSYFTLKIGVLGERTSAFKLAVAPTLEVLSPAIARAIATDGRRAHFGVPVSAEIDRGPARVYGSTGYFSRGLWFAGGGVNVSASTDLVLSAVFSRSWRRSDVDGVPLDERARNEISGGASYALTPKVSVFGSVGRTLATLEENGAGTTIGGGVAVWFRPPS